tara:strand:+ start:421 stop:612 length:192 start_codon:yes stop_codon:yes gene_type:complete
MGFALVVAAACMMASTIHSVITDFAEYGATTQELWGVLGAAMLYAWLIAWQWKALFRYPGSSG